MSSGRRACRSGKALEEFVAHAARTWVLDVQILPYRDWREWDGPVLLTNVPYDNIYGGSSKTEMALVLDRGNRCIRIECKWQAVSGSVDEKFPYLLLNMLNVRENEVLILIDGGGARQSAVDWCRRTAIEWGPDHGKEIRVVNMGQMQRWFQSGVPRLAEFDFYK